MTGAGPSVLCHVPARSNFYVNRHHNTVLPCRLMMPLVEVEARWGSEPPEDESLNCTRTPIDNSPMGLL